MNKNKVIAELTQVLSRGKYHNACLFIFGRLSSTHQTPASKRSVKQYRTPGGLETQTLIKQL